MNDEPDARAPVVDQNVVREHANQKVSRGRNTDVPEVQVVVDVGEVAREAAHAEQMNQTKL